MSLVAYDASSDDESDREYDEATKVIITKKAPTEPLLTRQQNTIAANGHISDEDDDFDTFIEEDVNGSNNSLSKLLPKPKNETNLAEILENFAKPTFAALPTPKAVNSPVDIEEEDDEFLHKKPNEEIIEKPNKDIVVKKMPVKITVPSLKNFKDVETEMSDKTKNRFYMNRIKSEGSSGLLSILPEAKSEKNYAKVTITSSADKTTVANKIKDLMPAFVPDTVKHRRPATNTEDVDRHKPTKKKLSNPLGNSKTAKPIESEESDDDDVANNASGDFFSFNADKSLPEVSVTEINSLVAKKAAKMAETTVKYLHSTKDQTTNELEMQEGGEELMTSRKRYHQEQQLNPEALQALVGGSTKRRRQHQEDIQVIDINSEQVLPNKDEWMRSALASSTTYQPTGVLVDEEPVSGTRRKHQITYLAHKAKANEAELQAMWSSNRQNRRATQNKYGF